MSKGKKSLSAHQGAMPQTLGQATEKAPRGRLAWGVAEIEEATGLSQPFIRHKIYIGELRAKRVGRRVLVMDEDLRAFLQETDYKGSEAAA